MTGAILKVTSFSTSTNMPPNPNIMVAPNCGSFMAPTITSVPWGAISMISTPKMCAFGSYFLAFSIIVVYAASTSAAVFRPTFTPPASDLWMISGETIFATIGKPMLSAICAASFGLVANWNFGTITPYSVIIVFASDSRSALRFSLRA